ncbi:amidase [Microbacterium capsulatum]|uniref:Amidase n=1 Tax=Microbacterium capsulatum TaxID=3041921 RepID=A0ABU0XHN5_9MICO|nr:amidase [Microbacterium sp. ASV81]MDQ4214629.1 amidase [Microbacterium sp. ASV81]
MTGTGAITETWRWGVPEAAAALADGEVTSAQLVAAALERIRATEDRVHAWAHLDAAGALAAARASDERRSAGRPRGPLDGVPIGVKDVIDVAGMPTRGGSEVFRDAMPARHDAVAVGRFRAAGGVLLGKTVTYEFAFGQGRPPTRNPRDPERYAGGSSIGSGVAVAVGSVPATLGTDTGGSVRNPASINGLVGLKPSSGLVSRTGSMTVSGTMDAIGPIAASVRGAALVLDAIAEPAALATHFGGSVVGAADRAVATRVGVDRAQWERWGVAGPVRAAVDEAIVVLERNGVEIVEVDASDLDLALTAGLLVSLSEAAELHRHRLQAAAGDYLPETRVMIASGALLRADDVELARRLRGALRRRLEELLAARGLVAIVSPTLPAGAPRLAGMAAELTSAGDAESLGSALRMLCAANLTGLPGLSVACGEVEAGPVGMHLLGRWNGDAEILALAERYEQAAPWRARVPLDPR